MESNINIDKTVFLPSIYIYINNVRLCNKVFNIILPVVLVRFNIQTFSVNKCVYKTHKKRKTNHRL